MSRWLLSTGLRYRLDHWARRLQGVRSCCLPPDFNVTPHRLGVVRQETVQLPAVLSRELPQLAGRLGVTLFAVFLAIYYCALRRALSASDLVILMMHHGRDYPELARLVGSFQNQIPLRIEAPAELSFPELARRLQEYCASASDHLVPYGNICYEFQRSHTSHVFPEFNFIPAAGAAQQGQFDQIPLQPEPTTRPVVRATAEQHPYHSLDIAMMGAGVRLRCTYLDILYRRDTILSHLDLFGELASWLAQHPHETVGAMCASEHWLVARSHTDARPARARVR